MESKVLLDAYLSPGGKSECVCGADQKLSRSGEYKD